MDKVTYEDWTNKGNTYTGDQEFPEGLTSFEVAYDGGRFYLCINGVEIFNDKCAGNDFCVSGEKRGNNHGT